MEGLIIWIAIVALFVIVIYMIWENNKLYTQLALKEYELWFFKYKALHKED